MGGIKKKLLGIKTWAAEDRPREKLLLKGSKSLSETELIAILIRSGTFELSAVGVAKELFQSVEYSLNMLARLSVKDLMKNKGIGEAKAITIIAAMELGRRNKGRNVEVKPKINSAQDAFDVLKSEFMDLSHEECWVLLLNRAHKMIKKYRISTGGVSGTVVDPKMVYKLAIEELASGIIIAHNHPSGNLSAGQHDIKLTKKLKAAGEALEIHLLDHLIIAGHDYLSFADKGLL